MPENVYFMFLSKYIDKGHKQYYDMKRSKLNMVKEENRVDLNA